MNYSDSLWSQAPAGSTHWAVFSSLMRLASVKRGQECWLRRQDVPVERSPLWCFEVWVEGHWSSLSFDRDLFTDLHERPQCYQSPAQLIEAYRKEHGAEIEVWAQQIKVEPPLEWWVRECARMEVLLDHLLAAERARVEGVEK